MTTPQDAAKPRQTLKQIVQERVIGAQPDHFSKWLAKNSNMVVVRDRQVATTMLSTYIEECVKATEGVFFTNPETVNIVIAKRKPGTTVMIGGRPSFIEGELIESKAIKVTVPQWMTDYIMAFPNAPWARG